jgi:hypothetical protein
MYTCIKKRLLGSVITGYLNNQKPKIKLLMVIGE